MKPRIKKHIYLLPIILLALLIGAICYYKYTVAAKEVVIDNCFVRGITYDDRKTLLVVELPDHTLAIVDATVHWGGRTGSNRPSVLTGESVRCRWKNGDLGKMGYCNWEKGDIRYGGKYWGSE